MEWGCFHCVISFERALASAGYSAGLASPNYIMPCILTLECGDSAISVFKGVLLDEHKILQKRKEKQKLTCLKWQKF